ncbi:cupredoxin domain-containing protein [Pseudoalteromonas sp. S16_S37]|uniref:cupredoxin domain-containing protein n=1 Tax=Pseudoalteromonas sp. S16_S37 TaxID=2720228 RepID=UPI00406C755E|nr:cupredoxin domain-containing protein [Pseudoalteromonas sp. S16_S37]
MYFCMLFGMFTSVKAAATDSVTIVLKNHLFIPAQVDVPAGKKVRLIIDNQDETAEEFDSFDLNREKVLFPKRKSIIYIGPLSVGEYRFFGEFSPNTAQGVVIAKESTDATQ